MHGESCWRASCLAVLMVAILIAGCSEAGPSDPGTGAPTSVGRTPSDPRVIGPLDVRRSTVGDLTTVQNLSGSRWGGVAELREEVSIGVDAGDDPYMFGSVGGMWATDENIYVADSRVPAVRVYDAEGVYLRDIGRQGQGPGEYERPARIAIADDGRIFLQDGGETEVMIYTAGGEYIDTWGFSSTVRAGGGTMILSPSGVPHIMSLEYEIGPDGRPNIRGTSRSSFQALGPEGRAGGPIYLPKFDLEPAVLRAGNAVGSFLPVPYAPGVATAFAPSGAVVGGTGDSYGFSIWNPDGSRILVERYWDPVPVPPGERDYLESLYTKRMRRYNSGFSWNGPPVPDHKPAFLRFLPDYGNRVLVSRDGPSEYVEGCDEDPSQEQVNNNQYEPCYPSTRTWDMFDLDGDYLGEIRGPIGQTVYQVFARGSTVLLAVEDEAGVIRVKRYGLVLPDER